MCVYLMAEGRFHFFPVHIFLSNHILSSKITAYVGIYSIYSAVHSRPAKLALQSNYLCLWLLCIRTHSSIIPSVQWAARAGIGGLISILSWFIYYIFTIFKIHTLYMHIHTKYNQENQINIPYQINCVFIIIICIYHL